MSEEHLDDESQDGQCDLYPIAVLLEELKNGDVSCKINALRKIPVVAEALGPDRTRNELIKFLEDTPCDEDEFRMAQAEELGKLAEYVGGPEYAYLLLPPLEKLTAVDEETVRGKAIESILKIAEAIPVEHVEKYFMETIERLSSGEWFTDKMSACSLYALACKRLKNAPEASEKLKKMLASMCEDETPMVRRAAATNMPNFIKQISREDVISFMLPLFKKLCSDCQDSVRLLMVNVYPHIARALTPEESKIYIKDTLLNLCNDKSWRIRYMVAENFIDLAECSKGRLPSHELCIRFSSLLLDREPEVRAAAASHLPEFCEKTHPERVLDVIMPSVASLVDDPSLHVRITLAERINALSKTLGEKNTMTELLPLLLHLLRDEMSDVRLNVISHLESIIEVIGFKTLAGYLLPSITELAGDKKWRVRLAIVQKIPMLAKQTRMELNELLQSLCITWLKDPVYTIRELAAKNLKILTEILGIEWIKQSVFPDILEMTMSGNYHHRIITIICIKTIFPVIFPDEFFNEILKIILMLCKDPVPNIRVNVTFALHEIMLFLNDENIREQIIKNDIIPVLEQLRTDEDLDVSYYSEIAYRAAEKLLAGETPPQPVFYSQAPL